MNRFVWNLAFISAFMLAIVVLGAALGGNIALAVAVSGWWLLAGIPIGLIAVSASVSLCTWILNDW